MQHCASILPMILIWLAALCAPAVTHAFQSTSRQPTPDPYFTPEKATAKPKSTPLSPLPGWQSPDSTQNSDSASALWSPPQTPVAVAPADKKQSSPQRSSIIRENQASNSQIKSLNGDLNQFIKPLKLPNELAKNRPDNALPAKPTKPIKSDANAFSPKPTSNEFTADLSSFSRAQAITPRRQPDNDFSISKNTNAKMDKANSRPRQPNRYPLNPIAAENPQPKPSPKSQPVATVASNTKPIAKTPSRGPRSKNDALINKKKSTSRDADSPAEEKLFEPTRLLAMVGNEPIFVGDMMLEINQILDQFMPGAPQALKNKEVGTLIKRLLPKFVDSKILYVGAMQALPEGADVEAILEQAGKEFDENAMAVMMKESGVKSAAQFDAHLRVQGSSLRKLRETWSKDQITRYLVAQELNIDDKVSHQEMLDEYHKRIEEYAVPAKSKWEQIMIRFDRSDSRSAAKEELIELGNQIVYGANLAAVAKKHSHGFRASEGGQHDWTSKGALVLNEIDEAIFTLPVGELSEVIETRDGFHIVRVIDRTEATHKPFLKAQVEIKERLLEQQRDAAFKQHLQQLRDQIHVEYFSNSILDK